MPANTEPIFPYIPTIACASLDITGDHDGANAVLLYTAAQFGSRIDRITIVASGTTVATVVRLWIDPAPSSTKYLYHEVAVAANTTSETAIGQRTQVAINLTLEAGAALYASVGTNIGTGTSHLLHITVEGGDY